MNYNTYIIIQILIKYIILTLKMGGDIIAIIIVTILAVIILIGGDYIRPRFNETRVYAEN